MNSEQPKTKRQLLKYLWAVAVSGLVIVQVLIDKDNKYLPLIHRTLDLMQRHYPIDLIHDKSKANQIQPLQLPTLAPNSSTNNADMHHQDFPNSPH